MSPSSLRPAGRVLATITSLALITATFLIASPPEEPAAPGSSLESSQGVGDFAQAAATARPNPQDLKGKPAPDFNLDLLAGGAFKLSEEQGKSIVLLDFWATWCGPCRRAMPALKEVSDKYHDKGVRYYAVDLRETPDKIRAYLETEKLDIAVPLDKDGGIAKKYKVTGIPTMFIIDKKGVVRDVHVGFSPSLKDDLEKALDKIISEG